MRKVLLFGVPAMIVAAVIVWLLTRSPAAPKPRAVAAGASSERADRGDETAERDATRATTAPRPTARVDRKVADELRARLHELLADAGLAWGTAPAAETASAQPAAIRIMPAP